MPQINWPVFWALIAAFCVRGIYRGIVGYLVSKLDD